MAPLDPAASKYEPSHLARPKWNPGPLRPGNHARSVEFLGVGAIIAIENRLSPVLTGFGKQITSSYWRPLLAIHSSRVRVHVVGSNDGNVQAAMFDDGLKSRHQIPLAGYLTVPTDPIASRLAMQVDIE
jgi:hypothetical protein